MKNNADIRQGRAVQGLPREWMGQIDGSQRQIHVLQ